MTTPTGGVQSSATPVEVRRRIPYFQASTAVVRDRRLSTNARTLYGILCSYSNNAGESWPSVETLTEDLGTSESTFKRARAELQESGYLRISKRLHVNGRQRSNLYTLVDLIHMGVTRGPLEGVTHDPGRGSPMNPSRRGSPMTPLEVPNELEGECAHGYTDHAACAICRRSHLRQVGS